jgi:hypothetical protein
MRQSANPRRLKASCFSGVSTDWYEDHADLGGTAEAPGASPCNRASDAVFNRAYPRATRQAFLKAQELAARTLGGVFHLLRYDNLTLIGKKILGIPTRRDGTLSGVPLALGISGGALHAGRSSRKGGTEGDEGYFRRNHWVPVPKLAVLRNLTGRCWLLAGKTGNGESPVGGRRWE